MNKNCRHCKSEQLFRSRRARSEKIIGWLFGVRPYRCQACHRRYWAGVHFNQHPIVYLSSVIIVATSLSATIISTVYLLASPQTSELYAKHTDQPQITENTDLLATTVDSEKPVNVDAWQAGPAVPIEVATTPKTAPAYQTIDVARTADTAVQIQAIKTIPEQRQGKPRFRTRWRTNVRAGAGSKHAVITTLKSNRKVAIRVDPGGDWVKIESVGITGWIYRPLLEPWKPD